jgi:hypothetical protein
MAIRRAHTFVQSQTVSNNITTSNLINFGVAAEPSCPSAMLQWQHGSYTILPNESLALQPILSDGRQLMSQPCLFQTAIYSTYNQTELFKVRFSTLGNGVR